MENPAQNNPVILVVGPYKSGQRTFIRAISEIEGVYQLTALGNALWAGRIALDDEMAAYLVRQPETRRIDYLWEVIMGGVVLLDSTNPETLREVDRILNTCRAYTPAPFVVAANKQDIPGAWSIEDLRHELHLPNEIPVVPCIATDKKSVSKVLITLLYKVLEKFETNQTATNTDNPARPR